MPLLDWRDRERALLRAALALYRLLELAPKLHYGDAGAKGDYLDGLKALKPRRGAFFCK